MIIRIILEIAMLVFAADFIWFAAQLIWLGIKEFFRIHNKTPTDATTATAASATSTATTVAP